MAITDVSTYQALVGRIQGAEKFYMKSGGQLDVASGSIIEVQTSGSMKWASTTLEGREIELEFLSAYTNTVHGSDDFSLVTGGTLSPAYGFHVFSGATGISLGILTMPIASKGATLRLDAIYLSGDGNISVDSPSTIALILNARGSDLSSFELSQAGFVDMICLSDGTWQVVNDFEWSEHPSS